ncbi:hypothetical protein HN011_011668 [Eciton burchellii]|jgi:hypothetical protein|nr:hypothetical protein HN011_011668 [Eciton burchellii]
MEDFIPTRGSQLKKNATNDYISINYEAPKKKIKPIDDLNNKEKLENVKPKLTPSELKEKQEKEMKKARYDIIKFGMSNFEKTEARKTKINLAISLGAVQPKKNRRMNYSMFKMRQKQKKEKEKEEYISGFKNSLVKSKSKTIRRKKDSDILEVYGKIPKNNLSKKKK